MEVEESTKAKTPPRNSKIGKQEEREVSEINKSMIYDKFKENHNLLKEAKEGIKSSEIYKMYIDGVSEGNPGKSGCGYIIYDSKDN